MEAFTCHWHLTHPKRHWNRMVSLGAVGGSVGRGLGLGPLGTRLEWVSFTTLPCRFARYSLSRAWKAWGAQSLFTKVHGMKPSTPYSRAAKSFASIIERTSASIYFIYFTSIVCCQQVFTFSTSSKSTVTLKAAPRTKIKIPLPFSIFLL